MDNTNNHVARVRLQSAFITGSLRGLDIAKGVTCMLGQLKGNRRNSAIEYHFNASQYSINEARAWLTKNNIKYMRIESAPALPDERDILSNQLKAGEFEVFIRGTIGFDVSGIAVAEEIDRLNAEGATKITERINSAGGDVIDGFNIVSANLRSNAQIVTINEGVAASMAAVILATGDVRQAFDFSTALIHDPSLGGKSLSDQEDDQVRANLTKIKNSLVKILKDATGQTDQVIGEIMGRETVLSATEQRKFGLVTNVIKSRVKKAPANLTLLEVMNHAEAATANPLEDTEIQTFKTRKMEQLTNFLKLQSDASEGSILAAVQNLATEANTMTKTLESTQNELAEAKQALATANESLGAAHKANVVLAVNAAIESGKFTDEQRETLTTQATQNLTMFSAMVEAMPIPHASALDQIQAAAVNGDNTYKNEAGKEVKKDFDWYQKNDPVGLQNLQRTNPKEFERMYNEYAPETAN